eukprot:TRINITY_DN90049_c0_g1_i1.p1 TRINITY_DN90049_c0_g1~~TRINITY_DN90049_c0_g1_i1.p1  ORF type:complete len:129 (-),score=7.59 TRINITY_DN90049_c0_g1_i1:100-486(-)
MSSSSLRFSDISFGGVSDPNESEPPSWRNGIFADWELQVGERRFNVHKAIIARSSKVLAACVSGNFAVTGRSDLTDLLPESTHSVFEDVLDHIYQSVDAASASSPGAALCCSRRPWYSRPLRACFSDH